MNDRNNNWQLWDTHINSLVSNASQTLNNINPVTVIEGLSGLPGSYAVFVSLTIATLV
jgi:hypothetical protein